MQRALDVLFALQCWSDFLAAYAAVEPGTAFDLRGDPPQFIADLQRQQAALNPA